ncbi:MAG: glycoside hydrolase family 36 protein [Lachnospiraceae bacterium]|jgi:alpha-galactosidase
MAVGYRVECTGRGSFEFPPLILMAGERMQDDLETAARRIGKAMHARLSMPPVYHWCSWYYCYHNFDLPQLSEYLDGLTGMAPKIPIRYIQIDAGYFPSAGDWLEPNPRFPHGLEEAFRMIRDAGYLPGIWIAPYMVGNRSRLYREHPDWILYDVNDRPVRGVISDNEPKPWGYQDEEYYILDTSHPDAMNYLKHVFETFYAWGARLFKTDFMVWGLQDSTAVKRHTPGKTSVEYFRDFLKMVRSVIGDESYWLGCIAPFMPFIGYADGMRIGNDVGSSWNGDFGPKNMIRCLTGNNFANHNFYQTDPDAVMLRDFHIRLTGTEVRSLALLAGLSGGCIYTSDPLHLIAKDRADLFRYIRPDRRRKPYLPYLQQKRDDLVMVYPKEEKGRGLLFLFNTGEGTVTNRYSLKDLGFSKADSVTDMESEKREETLHGEFTVTLEKHESRLCLVSEEKNPAIDHENLWKNL